MNTLPTEIIISRAAWTTQTLEDDSTWIRQWSEDELVELRGAVHGLRNQEKLAFEFVAEDFKLPTLASVLSSLRQEVDHGRGVLMLRGIKPGEFNRDELDILYAGIGLHLGHPITQNSAGARLVEVRDRGTDYGRSNVRGHTSNGAIAPHCDSSDVVGLLCINAARAGGESQVASAIMVFNLMLRERPELAPVLARGFNINLAGKGPTGQLEECTRHRVPIFSFFDGTLSCRYNEKQIRDAQSILGLPLSDLEDEAISYVGEAASRDGVRFDMEFHSGDIQLLNNHGVLHARGAFRDSSDQDGRLLLRMWLNTPGSRALAPNFADRLNSGPRGEVTVLEQTS
jgi:hypothetical protein